jgi:hypothetical protein
MKLKLIPKTKKNRIIFGIVLLIIAGVAVYMLTRNKETVQEANEPAKKYYSQLTGVEVEKDISKRPILGIMIENSEEARPQTGLDAAGIVFETVTEGGITRYLALYQENLPDEVGPVRSARPAFVDWAMGLDATYVHFGGSEEGLQKLESQNAKHFDGRFYDDIFRRSPSRVSPHNVYVKLSDLVKMQSDKGHKTAKFTDIPRSDDAPSTTPTATIISLQFSHPIFGVQFKYDPATNTYARSLAGAPHIDLATNKQITVKNVVVLKMSGDMSAIGTGEAFLYKDGTVQNVKWQQTDFRSRIKLLDAVGNEVALNRGDTWISALPTTGTVTNQ